MTACFMKQHSATSAFDYHRHCTRRGRPSTELCNCLIRGCESNICNLVPVKKFEPHCVAEALITGLHSRIPIGHNADPKCSTNLGIRCEDTFSVSNKDLSTRIGIASRYLHDGAIDRPSRFICFKQEFNFASFRHTCWIDIDVVHGM